MYCINDKRGKIFQEVKVKMLKKKNKKMLIEYKNKISDLNVYKNY